MLDPRFVTKTLLKQREARHRKKIVEQEADSILLRRTRELLSKKETTTPNIKQIKDKLLQNIYFNLLMKQELLKTQIEQGTEEGELIETILKKSLIWDESISRILKNINNNDTDDNNGNNNKDLKKIIEIGLNDDNNITPETKTKILEIILKQIAE